MNEVDKEFLDPDYNLLILEKELQQEIQALQADMQVITNREVLGFATRRYIELKEQYFNLLATDLKLLKLYEKDNENLKEEEQEFKPM